MKPGFAVLALALLHLTATAQMGAQGFELRRLEFEGTRYAVVSLDLREVRLVMRWKDASGKPYKRFSRLGAALSKRGERLLAAMNAGIFDTGFRPLGLHVENAQVLHDLNPRQSGYGNFYLQPNGVFVISPSGARILTTSAFARQKLTALQATQSGPMLVVENTINAAFQRGSDNRLMRNGVGVESNTRVHLVLALDPVNFFDFARFMKEGLKCPDALYLDGNISRLNVPGTDMAGDGEFAGILTVIAL